MAPLRGPNTTDAPRSPVAGCPIAGHLDAARGQTRVEPVEADLPPAHPTTAARAQGLASPAEERHAERLQHAGPASLVALPPMPMIEVTRPGIQRCADQLAGTEAGGLQRISQPGGTSASPLAAAISITAVAPSPVRPKNASTRSPTGPGHPHGNPAPPVVATIASTVPSPPSATGTRQSTPRNTSRKPASMANATSAADRLSLEGRCNHDFHGYSPSAGSVLSAMQMAPAAPRTPCPLESRLAPGAPARSTHDTLHATMNDNPIWKMRVRPKRHAHDNRWGRRPPPWAQEGLMDEAPDVAAMIEQWPQRYTDLPARRLARRPAARKNGADPGPPRLRTSQGLPHAIHPRLLHCPQRPRLGRPMIVLILGTGLYLQIRLASCPSSRSASVSA